MILPALRYNFRPMDQDVLQQLSGWLEKKRGIRLLDYKNAWLQRRLQIRLRATHASDLSAYYEYISKHPAEVDRLLESLSINITSFFRDPGVFGAIGSRVFEPWLASARSRRSFQAWSCACARGQEAYSLSALWQFHAAKRAAPPNLVITASDVDSIEVSSGRRAQYDASALAEIPSYAQEYFAIAGGHLLVQKKIRDRVQFVCENVLSPVNRRRFDLILCRNFLMFMDRTGRDAMMRVFEDCLVDRGILVVGRAEVIPDTRRFFVVDAAHRIYRKQEKG